MKLESYRQIFEKILKFQENSSSGSRVVPWGSQTDRHDKANSRFFEHFANAPKKKVTVTHFKDLS